MRHNTPDRDEAFTAARAALLASYSGTLATTRMTPFEALECLAAAIGSIYREVADAHLDPQGCPCGWQPFEQFDIAALQEAILANAGLPAEADPFNLRALLPVGHG